MCHPCVPQHCHTPIGVERLGVLRGTVAPSERRSSFPSLSFQKLWVVSMLCATWQVSCRPTPAKPNFLSFPHHECRLSSSMKSDVENLSCQKIY